MLCLVVQELVVLERSEWLRRIEQGEKFAAVLYSPLLVLIINAVLEVFGDDYQTKASSKYSCA